MTMNSPDNGGETPEICREARKTEAAHPGFQIAGRLKLGGCILVLVLTAAALIILLTSGTEPIKGYKPPMSSEYYGTHMDEFRAELEENVFPRLKNVESWSVKDGKMYIVLTGEDYAVARAALLHYYSGDLFVFASPDD